MEPYKMHKLTNPGKLGFFFFLQGTQIFDSDGQKHQKT